MERWLVELQGERFDLDDLVYWFPDGEVYAFAEADSFFLTGPRFDREADAKAVLEVATAALDEYCGAIKVLLPNFRPPKLGNVLREDASGHRQRHGFARLVGGELRIKSGRLGRSTRPTQAQRFLASANASRHLRLVLELWADAVRTWPRLYRVVEELEAHLGTSVERAGLCTGNELERFNRTANTAEVAGKDARHGSGKFTPPKNPMSLSEGTEFVRRLIEQTLRQSQ